MRIVSWNCNGCFRDKFSTILESDADIYVIQECENPHLRGHAAYKSFARNSYWIGDNPNKGLGIFAKEEILISKRDWPSYCLQWFLPVQVNNSFDLLGVWACKPYISEYYIYQNINMSRFRSDMVIIGDFNSNAIWDKEHKVRNHSTVVRELSEIGLASAYHSTTLELQGCESTPTFYQYRHKDKGFHIDHCFVAPSRISNFQVLTQPHFSEFSDHQPLCLDLL